MKHIRLAFIAALALAIMHERVPAEDRDELEWEARWEKEVKDQYPLPVFIPMPDYYDSSYSTLDQHTGTYGEAFLKSSILEFRSGTEK